MGKIIICGPRDLWLTPEVIEDIVHVSGFKLTTLICGMAKGVDMSAFTWAYEKQIPIIQKPYKSQYGKLGGFMRNQEMVDIADAWIGVMPESGLTTGTKDCYDRAKKACIPMYLYNVGGLI